MFRYFELIKAQLLVSLLGLGVLPSVLFAAEDLENYTFVGNVSSYRSPIAAKGEVCYQLDLYLTKYSGPLFLIDDLEQASATAPFEAPSKELTLEIAGSTGLRYFVDRKQEIETKQIKFAPGVSSATLFLRVTSSEVTQETVIGISGLRSTLTRVPIGKALGPRNWSWYALEFVVEPGREVRGTGNDPIELKVSSVTSDGRKPMPNQTGSDVFVDLLIAQGTQNERIGKVLLAKNESQGTYVFRPEKDGTYEISLPDAYWVAGPSPDVQKVNRKRTVVAKTLVVKPWVLDPIVAGLSGGMAPILSSWRSGTEVTPQTIGWGALGGVLSAGVYAWATGRFNDPAQENTLYSPSNTWDAFVYGFGGGLLGESGVRTFVDKLAESLSKKG